MDAIITSQKRECSVEGISGKIKLQGNVSLEADSPKVKGFNLTVLVDSPPVEPLAPEEAANPQFVWAGNIIQENGFSCNLQPAFSGLASEVIALAFAMIANLEGQFAAK